MPSVRFWMSQCAADGELSGSGEIDLPAGHRQARTVDQITLVQISHKRGRVDLVRFG